MIFFLLSLTVADISVQAHWTDPQLIIQTAGIKVGEEFQPSSIQNAIENLNRLQLFDFIAIDTTIMADGIFIKIILDEAPFLKGKPKFIGNKKIKTRDLEKKIGLRPGQVLTQKTIFDATTKIKEYYKEKHFYNTVVHDSLIKDTTNKAYLYFIINEGSQPRVGKIIINGNEAISDSKLKRKMATKEKGFLRSGKLDRKKLKEDIEKLKSYYEENGFLDVKIEDPKIEVKDNKFIITINIQENRKYYIGKITFKGNTVFDTTALRHMLAYHPGEVYNLTRVEKTLQAFNTAYWDEGYIYCSIIPDETVEDSVINIEYIFNESTPANINRVIITGNYKTREKVIRREIVTFPGERFRRSAVIRSQREIFNLGYFEDIGIDTENPDSSGNIDLVYNVKEKEGVGTIGAGMAYSAQDKLTGYLELSHPNLFGRGQRIYTKLEIGGRLTNFQIGFVEPWLFDTRTTFGTDLYYTNRLWDFYTKRDIGFSNRVSFPFYLDYTRFSYSLRTERTQILNISSSYTPPGSGYSLFEDTIPKWTVANSFGLTRDTRDYIFNPSSGSYISLNTEFAKKFLFANVDYNRYTFEIRTYYPVFWKFVLMTRLKAGIVTSIDEVPFYKRFYAGGVGVDGIRGYTDRSISPEVDGRKVGGKAILINNIELKLKISQRFALLAFYDAGNAYQTFKDVNLHELYRGAGIGIRVEIPMMGVVGFDLGYGFDRENPGFEPHFQINPFGMF